MNQQLLVAARDQLLHTALTHFRAEADVLGIFLSGSLAAGTADAYSDIDLRVIVRAEGYAAMLARRHLMPRAWPGFLFDVCPPHAQHCVSHFQPFGKIDIFYYSSAALPVSPWHTHPTQVLHDPHGMVADMLAQSQGLGFEVSSDTIDLAISQALAAAHEVYRRIERGELYYAQTLLGHLRHAVMQADDWLHNRPPENAVYAKFERRGSSSVLQALQTSFDTRDKLASTAALATLAALHQTQIAALHAKFQLSRPLENDLAALAVISSPAA